MDQPIEVDIITADLREAIFSGDFNQVHSILAAVNDRINPHVGGQVRAIEVVMEAWETPEPDETEEDVDPVLALARNEVEAHSGEFEFLHAFGVAMMELDEFESSEYILREVCILEPTSFFPPLNLGLALRCANRYEEAALCFEQAIKLGPDFPPCHFEYAMCLQALGRLDETQTAYVRYLELEPGDDHTWVTLAIVRSDLGDYEGAYTAFGKAEAIEPTVSLYFNWGICAGRGDDRAQLEKCANALEAQATRDWRTAMTRADVLAIDGDIDVAWSKCREAFEIGITAQNTWSHEFAVECALRFAHRHGFGEQTSDMIDHVFAERVFTVGVLEALRSIVGRASKSATCYHVLVEGRPCAQEQLSPPDVYGGASVGYMRQYAVWAESKEEARALAIDFENRVGFGDHLCVDEIESDPDAESCEEFIGVAHCEQDVGMFPLEDEN